MYIYYYFYIDNKNDIIRLEIQPNENFCVPITFNNHIKVCFSNNEYNDSIQTSTTYMNPISSFF